MTGGVGELVTGCVVTVWRCVCRFAKTIQANITQMPIVMLKARTTPECAAMPETAPPTIGPKKEPIDDIEFVIARIDPRDSGETAFDAVALSRFWVEWP